MTKVLMKGNEVIAEAAIRSGCKFFFGYPITPQSELAAYAARRLTEIEGGLFLQAESEVAAINMVYGAASAGARVMTSSSSPGFSLKQEGISFLASAQLPCVLVNVMRGGPGLGNIQPSQSDYFQATRGGGHGDYYMPVFAPASLQEIFTLINHAFNIADIYRTPVTIVLDGLLGQMMEPVELSVPKSPDLPPKDWATTGTRDDGAPKIINTLFLDPETLAQHNIKLVKSQQLMKEHEVRYEKTLTEDAEIVVVAYGSVSRIAINAIEIARKKGIKAGMIRPISLWPFPVQAFSAAEVSKATKAYLVVEMSNGQMIEDVLLSVNGRLPVSFFGRTGGIVPTAEEIVENIIAVTRGEK